MEWPTNLWSSVSKHTLEMDKVTRVLLSNEIMINNNEKYQEESVIFTSVQTERGGNARREGREIGVAPNKKGNERL